MLGRIFLLFFFTQRHWNRLPEKILNAPSRLGGIQGQAGWVPGQPDLVGSNQPIAEAGATWAVRSLSTHSTIP